jgi:hypothetical protein
MHDDDQRDQALAWLDEILTRPSDAFYDGAFDRPGSGGAIERLLWELNLLGASVTCVSDQWVRVDAVGEIKGRRAESHIQADTFLLALAESYRWWRDTSRELA